MVISLRSIGSRPAKNMGLQDIADRPRFKHLSLPVAANALLQTALVCLLVLSLGWLGLLLALGSLTFYAAACLFLSACKGFGFGLSCGLATLAIGLCVFGFPIVSAGPAAMKTQCASHLRQIGTALQNYRDLNGVYPPTVVATEAGKLMHSWRVLILPYMGYEDVFKMYDMDQPWDSPHNKKLIDQMPPEYRCPADTSRDGTTSYVAVQGSAFWSGSVMKESLAKLGSPKICLVETVNARIPWTAPRDLSLDEAIVGIVVGAN